MSKKKTKQNKKTLLNISLLLPEQARQLTEFSFWVESLDLWVFFWYRILSNFIAAHFMPHSHETHAHNMSRRPVCVCVCECAPGPGRWAVLLDWLAGVGGRQPRVWGPAGRGKQGARVGALPGPGAARLVAAPPPSFTRSRPPTVSPQEGWGG